MLMEAVMWSVSPVFQGTHQQTVEAGEQVVEDDHVTVDRKQRQQTCDRHQEENATGCPQTRATDTHTDTPTH